MAEEIRESRNLAAAEEAELVQYGAVSPLAIGALLLGMMSFLALFQLLLLIVPVLATLAALYALWQIHCSEGAVIGRTPAVIGLALALLFSAVAISGSTTRVLILQRHARQFGDAWLRLVEKGQLQRAHQLHLAENERQAPGRSLSPYYAANEQAQQTLNEFFGEPLLKQVANALATGEAKFLDAHTLNFDDFQHVLLRYRIEQQNQQKPLEFILIVERSATDEGGLWRAVFVSEPDEVGFIQ